MSQLASRVDRRSETVGDILRRAVNRYAGFGAMSLAFMVGEALVRTEELVATAWGGSTILRARRDERT
jgi:hypothetical protein